MFLNQTSFLFQVVIHLHTKIFVGLLQNLSSSQHSQIYMWYMYIHIPTKFFLLSIFRKVSIVEKQTSQTVEKEFQAGRDLIEDEFSEENRVKVEVYAYYAKSIGKNLLL